MSDQDIIDNIDVSLREHMTPGAPSGGSYCCAWAVLDGLRERYAIVEKPPPSSDERKLTEDISYQVWRCEPYGNVEAFSDGSVAVDVCGSDTGTVSEGRRFAAALLAAADKADPAEREQ